MTSHDPDDPWRGADPDAPGPDGPLDEGDPRYTGVRGRAGERDRQLVTSRGPGRSHMDPRIAAVRMILPVVAVLGAMGVVAVFIGGLGGRGEAVEIGSEAAVRTAIAEGPKRVCRGEQGPPCAWITLTTSDRLLALSTSGPLPDEFGRAGVGWCASSGRFLAPSTGSRFDAEGQIVEGPARRGLNRFRVRLDDGQVAIDFDSVRSGLLASQVEVVPPDGPDCAEVGVDRDADLRLD